MPHTLSPISPTNRLAHCMLLLSLCLLIPGYLRAEKPAAQQQKEETAIRAELGFLAGDALHGRGSGTRDEWIAATYIASELQQFGIQPGLPDGTFVQQGDIRMEHRRHPQGFEDVVREHTWNVVGVLPGTDPVLRKQYIMLSAHLDHLGVGPDIAGDSIYNGADDDGSGTVAVLRLAHFFGEAKYHPKRSILFVLFGSEELGGDGNLWFIHHPPLNLQAIVTDIEFEMIGRKDPLYPGDALWFTGSERSNLMAALQSQGAPLTADPRPTEQFFKRSDNYDLAEAGIVAHTASSFGLHLDYHHPSDDLSRINFPHMLTAINAMKKPLWWLANTNWTPTWLASKSPEEEERAAE
jgi:hypothetical protein